VRFPVGVCVFDLDDTLVPNRSREPIDQSLRGVLSDLASSIPLLVATGRPWVTAAPVIGDMGFAYVAAAGGSQIWSGDGQKVYQRNWSTYALERFRGVVRKIANDQVLINDEQLGSHSRLMEEQCVHVAYIMGVPSGLADRFCAEIADTTGLACRPSSSWVSRGDFDLHVTDNVATKESALLRMLEWLGAPSSRCLGFGDGLNDLEMLRLCGYRVAVGSSVPPILLSIADDVCRGPQMGGVEEFISRHLRRVGGRVWIS